MSDENWFPRNSDQIVNALRFGGFASFIPSVIRPVWDDVAAPFAGLPISICFTGLRLDDDRKPYYVVSVYWFDPQSYHDSAERRSMTYRSRSQSQYEVVIDYSKRSRSWEGRKMRGVEVAVTASNADFVRFVIQLTMQGLDDGEHVEPMLTRVHSASSGIWIYDPVMAETARTGRLQ